MMPAPQGLRRLLSTSSVQQRPVPGPRQSNPFARCRIALARRGDEFAQAIGAFRRSGRTTDACASRAQAPDLQQSELRERMRIACKCGVPICLR